MKQFTAHYELIIREGINTTVKYPATLKQANQYIKEYADAWSLNTTMDADGWLSACDNPEHPSHEAYLMQVRGEKYDLYLECCDMYGASVVDDVLEIVTMADPDGAWSWYSDNGFVEHQSVVEILFFNA